MFIFLIVILVTDSTFTESEIYQKSLIFIRKLRKAEARSICCYENIRGYEMIFSSKAFRY